MSPPRPFLRIASWRPLAAAVLVVCALAGCVDGGDDAPPEARACPVTPPPETATGEAPPDPARSSAIEAIAREAMAKHSLRALLVRVTLDGKPFHVSARGESLPGVPATVDMHFRAGAMGFTYAATILGRLADQGTLSLDDPVGKWLPELPGADILTLRMLANMTSGYVDYVYQPAIADAFQADPFRAFSTDDLIRVGTTAPPFFAPGTNWMYSHTNYAILGKVIARATGLPTATVMQQCILDPLGLAHTKAIATPAIPPPVLHSYSSERRAFLHIPPGEPFYEEATFWNPSWTTAEGLVLVTDLRDMTTSMEQIGAGALQSKASYAAQVEPRLAGFGHVQPGCPACQPNTLKVSYGLGVVLRSPWITQTKDFAGSSGTVGYLPAARVAVTVITHYAPGAYDAAGDKVEASLPLFEAIATVMTPATPPGSGPLPP